MAAREACCRSAARRRARCSKTFEWANDCIDSLNSAYGYAKREQPQRPLNASQRAALGHIESQFLQLGSPPEDSPGGAGALAELCAAGGPYHAEPSSTRPYVRGNVSLPAGTSKPVPLLDLLAEGDRKWLGPSCSNLLRPTGEAVKLAAEACPRGPFTDRALAGRPYCYADFFETL